MKNELLKKDLSKRISEIKLTSFSSDKSESSKTLPNPTQEDADYQKVPNLTERDEDDFVVVEEEEEQPQEKAKKDFIQIDKMSTDPYTADLRKQTDAYISDLLKQQAKALTPMFTKMIQLRQPISIGSVTLPIRSCGKTTMVKTLPKDDYLKDCAQNDDYLKQRAQKEGRTVKEMARENSKAFFENLGGKLKDESYQELRKKREVYLELTKDQEGLHSLEQLFEKDLNPTPNKKYSR